jgi:hypothetical protein
VQNTNIQAHSLKFIEINEDIRLCSFDIENMYTNIPTHKFKNMTGNIIDKSYSISQQTRIEIKNLLNVILEQNYIKYNGKWYKQNDGLAMGAPTSATLAEMFIQYLEHTVIIDILKDSK